MARLILAGAETAARWLAAVLLVVASAGVAPLAAQEAETPPPAASEADESPASDSPTAAVLGTEVIERVAAKAAGSVVVITTTDREGQARGVGSGFVVRGDGLIATNQHVIGEARPIQVQLADGTRHEVTEVHASDWRLDLALVKIPATGLVPLELGDAEVLRPGQAVIALGNPVGLRHSVVAGVVSATREIDGRPMIQLAIPVEPGNSGGPVVDLEGRVVGLLTTKSAVTANLGFAVTINQLRPLLAQPNPVPIDRWLTLGSLDAKHWKTVFGGRWRRRGGRIHVEGWGESFGGRALCLNQVPAPAPPYELTVTVKLDDEAGAAGLIFGSDGGERHYGFYPSGGGLRLTRFAGPDVNSWTILRQQPSPHYRPGEWNTLRLHRDPQRVTCWVNDHEVFQAELPEDFGPWQGLAKFRDTTADFRRYAAQRQLPPAGLAPELAAAIEAAGPEATSAELAPLLDRLQGQSEGATTFLLDEARRLKARAEQLEGWASRLDRSAVLAQLAQTVEVTESQIDLARGALFISRLDNPDVDVAAYLAELDDWAAAIRGQLPPEADAAARQAALDRYLFAEQGFHGSRTEYYTRANSYLDRVIDDREGLPITLAVLYIELARRLELDVVGIPLPGHFLVEWRGGQASPELIDVFDRGQRLSREQAAARVSEATGQPASDDDFAPARPRAILVRILRNLLGVSQRQGDHAASLVYLDATLAIAPEETQARMLRVVLRGESGDPAGALADLDWLLEHDEGELDRPRVEALRELLIDRAAQ